MAQQVVVGTGFKAKTFDFTIAAVTEGALGEGWTATGNNGLVTVTVTDDGEGNLAATVRGVTIQNSYAATPIPVIPTPTPTPPTPTPDTTPATPGDATPAAPAAPAAAVAVAFKAY